MTEVYLEEKSPNSYRLGRGDRRNVYHSYACSLGLAEPQVMSAHASDEGSQSNRHNQRDTEKIDNSSPSPGYPKTRRPEKRELSAQAQRIIDDWFNGTGIKLGFLEPHQAARVKRLVYTYQDLNSSELNELPPTDLYIHRVRITKGTVPWNKPKQRRWPPGKEFWLKRIITDGLRCGMYERCIEANGKLSDWNAQAQLVDKSDNPGEWDEPRLTFNYQNVHEDKPGCFVELMSRCHDYLGHPGHKRFHKADLKHGYWAILVHPHDRHYFAFTIPGIGQLQPTRMPQGSCSASFSFTELMNIVLGPISSAGKFEERESMLVSDSPNTLPKCTCYVDDIFSGFRTFEEGYSILENELFPRLAWAKLKLSFKKLELFVEETVALGVLHKAGGRILTKPERCEKIRRFPAPKNATEVRRFLGAIGMTRRWIKNFSEIKAPLSRLTGNVDFVWGEKEQLSFDLLKEKCGTVVEVHGWDFQKPVRLYSDASLFGAGCAITQMRIDPASNKLVEVPILYDAFLFNAAQKNYGIYKKELCAIVEFCRKYDYMLRGPETAEIFTDHKPLTFFLRSSILDGIYSRWAAELRCLDVIITWIPGHRNLVADSLSRTIFPDEKILDGLPSLSDFGYMVSNDCKQPEWVWKDGKNGYQELLRKIGEPIQNYQLEKLFFGRSDPIDLLVPASKSMVNVLESNMATYYTNEGLVEGPISVNWTRCLQGILSSHAEASEMGKAIELDQKYMDSSWYQDIARYLDEGKLPSNCFTKIQVAAFLKKASMYSIGSGGILFFEVRKIKKNCIVQKEVAEVLEEAHDKGGHFSWAITLRKLNKLYWPGMSKDVRDYILGCLVCAKNGTAVRSQTTAKVTVSSPMELLGIDFIGPFPKFDNGFNWILICTDYFSRFTWAEGTEKNDSETVIKFLKDLFAAFGVPVGFIQILDPIFVLSPGGLLRIMVSFGVMHQWELKGQ